MLGAQSKRRHQTRALAVTLGVGLGLSIARREGGRVWLERSGPAGSIVWIALPLVVTEPTEAAERERAVGEPPP